MVEGARDSKQRGRQISEPIPGIDIVGPIPAEVQSITIYAAGVASASTHKAEARGLIAFLSSPEAAAAVRATGMEPVTQPGSQAH